MHKSIPFIRRMLVKLASKTDKPNMEKYMRNQFAFFGVRSPKLDIVFKELNRQFPTLTWNELKDIALSLFAQKEREYQYLAIMLLNRHKKLWPRSALATFKKLVTSKSWWDTVDAIDTKLIGEYFLMYPEKKAEEMQKWIKARNLWLRRSALQFQLNYNDKTDWKLLSSLCSQVNTSDEFFIQTAIGWSLRQYSKVNKKHVQDFVDKTPLKPRAKKEALIFIQGKTS